MSQIQKKFIANDAVDGRHIKLLNNQTLRGSDTLGADVPILKVNLSDQIELQRLPYVASTLPMPSDAKHLVTVEYIENVIKGRVDAKDAVDALSDIPKALFGAAPFVVDGYTFTAKTPKSRVLLTGQTNAAENGIYDVTVETSTYTLTRSADFSAGTVTTGSYTVVINGTSYQGFTAVLTTPDPITVGTTPLTFVKYPSSLSQIGGDMIAKTGNVFSVDLLPLGGLVSTNPGDAAGQLKVQVDTAVLEKDKTTRVDPSSGAVVARKSRRFVRTLTTTDVSNGYVDLPDVAGQDSVMLLPVGGPMQVEGDDYTVNYTGGSSSKTRVTFVGGLATGGISALVAGDKVVVYYTSF